MRTSLTAQFHNLKLSTASAENHVTAIFCIIEPRQ